MYMFSLLIMFLLYSYFLCYLTNLATKHTYIVYIHIYNQCVRQCAMKTSSSNHAEMCKLSCECKWTNTDD